MLDRQLAKNEYVAGDSFTIADMAIWPWASLWEGQEQTLDDKPHMARWLDLLWQRPGVIAGRSLEAERRGDRSDSRAQQVIFGKTAAGQ